MLFIEYFINIVYYRNDDGRILIQYLLKSIILLLNDQIRLIFFLRWKSFIHFLFLPYKNSIIILNYYVYFADIMNTQKYKTLEYAK